MAFLFNETMAPTPARCGTKSIMNALRLLAFVIILGIVTVVVIQHSQKEAKYHTEHPESKPQKPELIKQAILGSKAAWKEIDELCRKVGNGDQCNEEQFLKNFKVFVIEMENEIKSFSNAISELKQKLKQTNSKQFMKFVTSFGKVLFSLSTHKRIELIDGELTSREVIITNTTWEQIDDYEIFEKYLAAGLNISEHLTMMMYMGCLAQKNCTPDEIVEKWRETMETNPFFLWPKGFVATILNNTYVATNANLTEQGQTPEKNPYPKPLTAIYFTYLNDAGYERLWVMAPTHAISDAKWEELILMSPFAKLMTLLGPYYNALGL